MTMFKRKATNNANNNNIMMVGSISQPPPMPASVYQRNGIGCRSSSLSLPHSAQPRKASAARARARPDDVTDAPVARNRPPARGNGHQGDRQPTAMNYDGRYGLNDRGNNGMRSNDVYNHRAGHSRPNPPLHAEKSPIDRHDELSYSKRRECHNNTHPAPGPSRVTPEGHGVGTSPLTRSNNVSHQAGNSHPNPPLHADNSPIDHHDELSYSKRREYHNNTHPAPGPSRVTPDIDFGRDNSLPDPPSLESNTQMHPQISSSRMRLGSMNPFNRPARTHGYQPIFGDNNRSKPKSILRRIASGNKTMIMRVYIQPHMRPGAIIRVLCPDHNVMPAEIPPRNKWLYENNDSTGEPFFRLEFNPPAEGNNHMSQQSMCSCVPHQGVFDSRCTRHRLQPFNNNLLNGNVGNGGNGTPDSDLNSIAEEEGAGDISSSEPMESNHSSGTSRWDYSNIGNGGDDDPDSDLISIAQEEGAGGTPSREPMASAQSSVTSKGIGWSCKACTMINDLERDACEICGTVRRHGDTREHGGLREQDMLPATLHLT